MAAIILPHRWKSQPQYPVEIDFSNPLSKGLTTFIDGHGNSLLPPVVSSKNLSFSRKYTNKGVLLSNNGSAVNVITGGQVAGSSGPSFTILGQISLNTTGQTNKYLAIDRNTSTNNQNAIIYGYSSNSLEYFSTGYTGSNPRTGTGLTITDTNPHIFAYARDGASLKWESYLDGGNVLNTTSSFSITSGINLSHLFGSSTTLDIINASIGFWAVWGRYLTKPEISEISANPWQIFRPINRRLYFGVSGGAGAQTLTPALYSNENTFHAPTVSAGAVTLTPSLFENQNAFYAPTISAPQTIAPELFSSVNAFYAPTVATGGTILPQLFTNENAFQTHRIGRFSVADLEFILAYVEENMAVLNEEVETGVSLKQAVQFILAANTGKKQRSGNTITFKAPDGTTDRIVGTVDADGNRTNVVLNGS
jgi:hypothetical protein